jgi:hypothetical protein
MALGRLQAKQVIKTCYPIDAAEGQAQLLGHLTEARLGQVAVKGLKAVQHLDQALRSELLVGDQLADARIGAHPPGPCLGQGPGGDWLSAGHLTPPHLLQSRHTPGLAAPFRAQGLARRQQGVNGAGGLRRPGPATRRTLVKRHRLGLLIPIKSLANDAYQYEPVEKFGESLTTARPWNVSALAGVEQLNGRAAMVGFSAALLGEWLTGKGIVGQLGLGLAWLLNPSW